MWRVPKDGINVNFYKNLLAKCRISVLCSEMGCDHEIHLNYKNFFDYFTAKIVKELLDLKMDEAFFKKWQDMSNLLNFFVWQVAVTCFIAD